jgi:hypothetical protein
MYCQEDIVKIIIGVIVVLVIGALSLFLFMPSRTQHTIPEGTTHYEDPDQKMLVVTAR